MATTPDRNDPGLRKIDEQGMQERYLVLSDEDISQGFVRPVRQTYVHVGPKNGSGNGCGVATTMAVGIARTYARDPSFYGATYCVGCKRHLPVGEDGEFVWDGTDERVGT